MPTRDANKGFKPEAVMVTKAELVELIGVWVAFGAWFAFYLTTLPF